MKLPVSSIAPLLVACAARAPVLPVNAPVTAPAPLLSLERTRCLGPCPAYRVEIDVDGAVRFTGDWNVCRDDASERLSPAKLRALRAAIARSNFARLAEHCCDCPVSDSATIRLTLADPPPSKTIIDAGVSCPGAPSTVRDLADTVDEIVDVWRWTTNCGP